MLWDGNIIIKDTTKESRSYPVVVLINPNSASAAEMLAAAFKEKYNKATVVGMTSFGKGTVQHTISLSTGAILKYTSQKWYTPNGDWIDGKGVTPDIVVDLAENEDNQLQLAISTAKNTK